MRRIAAAVLACATFCAAEVRAEEEHPAPGPLRLDESLALLEPFRHASGRSSIERFGAGPFGSWLRSGVLTAAAPSDERVDRCAERLLDISRGPFVDGARPWLAGAAALEISNALLPLWLRRLDAGAAHMLLTHAGCGLGGPCTEDASFPAQAFAQVWNALHPEQAPTPWWVCRERPLRLHRHGREQDTFVVLRCDGSIPDDALERLSLLARPPDAPRPEALPPRRDPRAGRGEWVPSIRLLHPRLLWVLHRIALTFPWRAVYIYSGYRPAEGELTPGTHKSKHAEGRALDIHVQGIANEELLALCNKLGDVGCGYYPNNKFVHLDIRDGGGVWVDSSKPGDDSVYLSDWPGVVERGRIVWRKPAAKEPAAKER
jgi:hypothetical protein